MVLVLPEFRRKGIGTALLKHAIAFLETDGVAAVRLDATPLGKKVYDGLTFRDEYGLERMEGTAYGQGVAGTEMASEELAEVAAFDEERFGADRSRMLRLLWNQTPELCLASRSSCGEIDGYLMARHGSDAFQIGPWIARNPDVAESLFLRALGALDGQRVFLDVPLLRSGPVSLVARHGFTTQRSFTRMYRGSLEYSGRPEDTYAICGVETG
jgi:hypothetical protein